MAVRVQTEDFDAGAESRALQQDTVGAIALFIGTVLGPQLVGHQGLDFALKWLPARTVSAVTLLEPVGASALAALFLGELPGPNAMLGGLFALVGVFATM